MSRFDELHVKLRDGEKSLVEKYSKRIDQIEFWRPWFGLAAVIGALVVGVVRVLPLPDAAGLGFTILGAILAAVGGGLVVLMDYKKLEISQDAKNALQIADDTLQTLKTRETELASARETVEQAREFDEKRLARIEAIRLMIESIEAAFLKNADVRKSAEQMLEIASGKLRRAMDYHAGDFLTFTLFQRTGEGEDEQMRPIAREWTDKDGSVELGRSWKKGDGYTGMLWQMALANSEAQVVESDTQLPDVRARYRVPNSDPVREGRYRSVASFPILIGKDNEVWGVVTVTSDRSNVFGHTSNLARQSVEAVRDVALAAGLLAKLRKSRRKG